MPLVLVRIGRHELKLHRLIEFLLVVAPFVSLVHSYGFAVFILTIVTPFIMFIEIKIAHQKRLQRLQEPLLANAAGRDHWVDAATREAAEGCKLCRICSFGNFKRASFCVLCGDQLDSTASVATAELNLRQLRAKKRLIWTRKMDIEGNLFWYREGSNGIEREEEVGLVVRLEPNRLCAMTETQVMEESSVLEGSRTEQDESTPGSPTGNEREVEGGVQDESKRSRLWKRDITPEELSPANFELIESKIADASILTLSNSKLPSEEMRDMLHSASLDFPSKYAHFVVSSSAMIPPKHKIEFTLRRDYALESSASLICSLPEKYLRTIFRINFVEDDGVDAGGVQREWFSLLNEAIANPHMGLFVCVNGSDQSYYINRHSRHTCGDDHLVIFFTIGRLVARGLLQGAQWSFHLAVPLLKLIQGTPITLDDLQYYDEALYKNLHWILSYHDVEELGLDFTVTEIVGDEALTIELVADGANVLVTNENKTTYVRRRFEYLLFESIQEQLFAFLKGFYEVVPANLLMIFDYEELGYLLAGSDEIDVDDWEQNSLCTPDLDGSRTVYWFWAIVREMPNEYRKRLLQFSTGSSRVPLGGFKSLTSYDGRVCLFTLKGVPFSSCEYIKSHACFNRLELPSYASMEELQRSLYATLDTDMFGFTTA